MVNSRNSFVSVAPWIRSIAAQGPLILTGRVVGDEGLC